MSEETLYWESRLLGMKIAGKEWLRQCQVATALQLNSVPSLAKLPFETGKAEAIFRVELFHCRDLIGSATVALCLLAYFDFPGFSENFPDRLERAWNPFRLWALANQTTPTIHYFSTSLFNSPNQLSFAWANVKGSD